MNPKGLADLLADLDEDAALDLVQQRIDGGEDPLSIIEDCERGIREVGERYARREYYVTGLIFGGEIFRQVVEAVEPVLKQKATANAAGNVLLGTAQGDIHDIGKNLLAILLRCHGFNVQDLGVDVAPTDVVAVARETRPDIIALSALVTAGYESIRDTIVLLREQERTGWKLPPVVIGGGMIDDRVCHYVGADRYATDALTGVRLCEELVAGKKSPHPLS